MSFYQILLILIVTAAADWLILRLWRRSRESGLPVRFPVIPKQALVLFFSLLLITAGQFVAQQETPIIHSESLSVLVEEFNHSTRLDLTEPENHLAGSLLMLAGAALFPLGCSRTVQWKQQHSPLPDSHPKGMDNGHPVKRPLFEAALAVVLFVFLAVRMFNHEISLLDPILWILIVSLVGIRIAANEKQARGELPSLRLSRKDLSILLALTGVGLLAASFRLTAHPAMLMGDEGNFFDTARAIASGKYLPSFFDMGVYSYPVASSYWQALVLKVFGASLWSWRFSSVIAGVLAVIPLYLLVLNMFGRRLAVTSSILYLASPYFLAFSRLGYNNAQVMFPVTLSILFLYISYAKRSSFFAYLAGVSAGLGFLTYTAARISLVLGGLILLLYIVKYLIRKSSRHLLGQSASAALVFSLGWFLTASPYLFYSGSVDPQSFRYKTLESAFINADAASPYFSSEDIFELSPGWQVDAYNLYFNPRIYGWLIQRGVLRTILAFFLPGLSSGHFLVSPFPGPFVAVFFLAGFSITLSKLRDQRAVFLLSWFILTAFLLSAVNTYPPRATHMVPVIPVMVIIAALGIEAVVKAISELIITRHKKLVVSAMLSITIVAASAAGFIQYYSVVPRLFKPDLDQVMNWAELSNNREIPFVYVTHRENWKNWKPFVIERFVPYRSFWVVTEDELRSGRYTLPSFDEVVVFFHARHFDEIAALGRKNLQIEHSPLFVKDSQGRIIGGILIKGGFIWPTSLSWVEDAASLIRSPAGKLSLILFLLSVLSCVPADRFRGVFRR